MDYMLLSIVLATQFALGWVVGATYHETHRFRIHKYVKYGIYYWPFYLYVLFMPPTIWALIATCLWTNVFFSVGYNFGCQAENKLSDNYSDAGKWITSYNKKWLNLAWLIGSLILGILISIIA